MSARKRRNPMEQNVEIKKPDPNPRDMAAGEIVVNVQFHVFLLYGC